MELQEFLPSIESLSEAEELRNAGLSENAHFHFLLKSGYEQIARASALPSWLSLLLAMSESSSKVNLTTDKTGYSVHFKRQVC